MREARGKIVSGQKESMTLVRINTALCDGSAGKQKQEQINKLYIKKKCIFKNQNTKICFVCLFVLVIFKKVSFRKKCFYKLLYSKPK